MSVSAFRYDGYEVDPTSGTVVCRYSTGDRRFEEVFTFHSPGRSGSGSPARAASWAAAWTAAWTSEAADAAARILFLLAGVSYYKTTAPPVVDLGTTPTTESERAFLRTFYVEGLAELAYRNSIDLSDLTFRGPGLDSSAPVRTSLRAGRPLVPFGAGIDSIVTATDVSSRFPETSLFVVSPSSGLFAAIEDAAAVTGLPVVRVERRLDPAVLRPSVHGFLAGHVPVTGIISAIAVMAAVLGGHDAVVMSNERSASVPTLLDGDHAVNHQWSKGAEFEAGLASLLAASFDPAPTYSSYLRERSELWVAERFASLERYHHVFRSCNRAFATDPARRLDHWCGVCDKCCFVDLVLAPFMEASTLERVFSGREPLADATLLGRFCALCGVETRAGAGAGGTKPFECVGDEGECREAALLAAERPDRSGCATLQELAALVRTAT